MIENRLKELRESVGMNKRQFAAAIGAKYTTYVGYEAGEREPGINFLIRVSELYDVSVDWLVGRTDSKIRILARDISPSEWDAVKKYRALDAHGKNVVDVVLDAEEERVSIPEEQEPRAKIIPLAGNSFAAGPPEPDLSLIWEDYSVPADSPAEFAIRISGDSMEPYLPDGSIAFGRKTTPKDGDVAALLLDGEFLCKQVCQDSEGNLYLFSLNRDRADADRTIWAHEEHTLMCFGTIIMEKRVPLPRESD